MKPTNNEFKWLLHGSPSLLLMLDEALVCHHMAAVWRNRLDESLSKKTTIPATELFDFENEAGLIDRFKAVLSNDIPIVNTPVGLFLSDGILPSRVGAWRVQHDNKPPFIMLAATDVSKYHSAIGEIDQIQTQHQQILDAAGQGIYGLDSEGRITFSNAAAERLVGWKAIDVLGKKSHNLHHHFHPDGTNYPQANCPIYATLKDGAINNVDNEVFWHANGDAIPVEYTSTPILKDGKPNGAVVVFYDISKRKQFENEREAAFNEIKELKDQLQLERDYLRDEINITSNFGEIIGHSQALKRSLSQIEAVAKTHVSVLILGESGVGKEMIARAIHTKSDRSNKPLVKVNCASIPKDLFESEFFGHVRGAFTGAHQDRIGRLQLADGGTLFLDEIGEIPLSHQGKLLRALQEGEFERVGDDKTINVNVRIVAATNRNLQDEINAGRFREDLYYRISVFPVEVPPLRHRLDDIAPLASHFIKNICNELGRELLQINQSQLTILKQQPWPGNIRELKNVIDRAVISSNEKRLRLDLALPHIKTPETSSNQTTNEIGGFVTNAEFKLLEKANITAAVQHAKGQIWGNNGAAYLLGIKPSTLAHQMKVLGIDRDK